MFSGPVGELTTRRCVTSKGGRNLCKINSKDIVQKESCPLERRQPLERQHKRKGDVLDFIVFNSRLRKPRADICQALPLRRFELVQAQTSYYTPEECLRLAGFEIRIHPANECFLDNIFGIRNRAQHAVCNAH
jgi:hypothetical protein